MQAKGSAVGLIWTSEGSSLIQLKAKVRKGTGKITINGDVDHDFLIAVEIAYNLFNSSSDTNLELCNITLDVPHSKNEPSVALPLFLCLHSAINKTPINQSIVFTGALSDTGAVMPVENIIDKMVASRRGGMSAIVFPMDNVQDLPPYSQDCPWGSVVLSPILRVAEALVISLPSCVTKSTVKV